MNQLTVVDRGGVKHPEIVTIDEAQNLLDQYGVGGQAVKVPNGVNLQKFLGRCTGGWYYDNAALSGTTGGPIKDMVYYTVINGGIPGNRAIVASSHGNNLWIAEVYGDVFRGWVTFARPDDVHNWIDTAIEQHESTVNHPYATEVQKGFIELATAAEATSKTEATRAMTSLRTQNLLDTYGIGAISIQIPNNSNLATYFNNKSCGFYHLDGSTGYGYTGIPTDVAFSWAEIICTAHEVNNYRALTLVTAEGRMYTASVSAGSFSGWRKKIELGDLPIASTTQAGIVQLNNAVNSTSVTQAATANAVKLANDNANTRVPSTRTVNGLALSSNISITAALVGAYTTAQVDSLVNARVPNTRRVNGKALSSDITINAGDVGTYTKAEIDAKIQAQTISLRLGPEVQIERGSLGKETFVYRAPGANVVTGFYIWSKSGNNDEFRWMYSRPIQVFQNGTWQNIGQV